MSVPAEQVEAMVERVRAEFAPDPRLVVFDVEVEVRGEYVALVGATSEPAAADALHHRMAELNAWTAVSDEVVRLPEGGAGESIHAVVTAAVAPMHAAPRISTTQISQNVLGSRLLVLRRERRWLQCRSADGYIGWVHAGYVALMHEVEARAWEMGTAGESWIAVGARVSGANGETTVRLPWGARIVREPDGTARLPDGRTGWPEGEMVPAAMRTQAFPRTGDAICASAARWLGVPYLWGGITMGGVDCSGFVQALFRMHGHELPRDADQQSRTGQAVDPGEHFQKLRPGDLLFFTEEPGRVTHVTLSTGGAGIIHSSLGNGGVARNRMDGRRNYERELVRIFLFARRVL
ncbi:MAG: glycoside hydrolase [Gemmatimonadetes bacterium]|nr:glycoside hydrolase [Gemmatimonadota bacterium]